MSVHLVLFLKAGLNIDFNLLITKMKESYKELDNGILIPKTTNNPNEPNFIFNNNKEILIDGNNHHISINLFNDYTKIKTDIIEMLWDAFDYCDLEFTRVGYIKEFHQIIENVNIIKNKLLNNTLANNIKEFQMAYHQIIKFERKNINCWKRFIKFNDTPLTVNYDINTKEDNIKNISYKFLKEFIKFSDKYIEEDINNLLKEDI